MALDTVPLGASPANPLRRLLAAVEPWYNWGTIHIERMEGSTLDRSGREGPVRFVELQWFGIHVAFQIGFTPKREG